MPDLEKPPVQHKKEMLVLKINRKIAYLVCLVGGIFLLTTPKPAFAVTNCQLTLSRVGAGIGGNYWLYFTNGGSATFAISASVANVWITTTTSAFVAGHQLFIQYDGTGVDCTSTNRSDIDGLYII